jgi:hypothetical protein
MSGASSASTRSSWCSVGIITLTPPMLLAADVCAVIKRRGDRFESDEELVQWLETDRVPFTPGSLSTALHQLTSIGRIKRNVADQWNSEQPLPGMYVEPRIRSA